MPHGGTIHILAAIHQCEKCAQNPRLDFVGHGETACSDMHERLTSPRYLTHEFNMAFMAGISKRGFAAHFGAFLLDEECEVQNALALRSEPRRHYSLAAF